MTRVASASSLAADLRAILADRVSVAAAVCDHHSHGESYLKSYPPDAVVFPESTEEVAAVVAIKDESR